MASQMVLTLAIPITAAPPERFGGLLLVPA
jgi:hypothetical protein